jgi:hypothetical protein
MKPHFLGWLSRQVRGAAQPRRYCPELDALEERLVPTIFKVAPTIGAGSINTFTTLSQAVTTASNGDTIIIEPGSTPGSATVTQNNLTIIGDPAFGSVGLRASNTQVTGITLIGNNDAVSNLYIGGVIIGIGATGQSITNDIFYGQGVTQAFGTGFTTPADGGNTVSGCTFVNGANVTLGDSGATDFDTAANDNVTNNVFWNPVLYAIKVQNEVSGLVIANNRITHTDPNTGMAFIEATDCTGAIVDNTLNITAVTGAIGILANDSAFDIHNTNLTISGNVVVTNQTGISLQHFSLTNTFTVAVTNNSLAGNQIGLGLQGNGGGVGADYGNLTITGNDFRRFVGNGNFAIRATEPNVFINPVTPPPINHINAEGNIWGASAAMAVNLSSAPARTMIDISNPMTGSVAGLTAMFETLGGGPPTASQLAADVKLSAAAQVLAAVTSPQAARTFVDNLYVTLLGRMCSSGEDQGWVNYLSSGAATEEQVLVGFLTSAEYFNKVGAGSANPNGAWIQSLYGNLLGRQAATGEVNGWLGAVTSAGPTAVVQAILSSGEFRTDQVSALYGGGLAGVLYTPNILKRPVAPSLAEITPWVVHGASIRNIELALLGSFEFSVNG